MLRTSLIKSLAAASTLAVVSIANAVPVFQNFGSFNPLPPLPAVNFGGSGIPTNAVAWSTFQDGDTTITVGLTAHQRYNNPPLTNDSKGTFYATPGTNDGTPGNPGTAATWNFAYYVSVYNPTASVSLLDYFITLGYDFDPAANTSDAEFGYLNLAIGDTVNQNSQNATFGFLTLYIPPLIYPPSQDFDPNEPGEYSFNLRVSKPTSFVATPFLDGTVGINVVVTGSVPDSGSSFALALIGLAGVGFFARRRRS